MASDTKRAEDIELGLRVPGVGLSRELTRQVLRLQHHMSEEKLVQMVRLIADRYDELEAQAGDAIMRVSLRAHRGRHRDGAFDPDIRL